MILRKPEMFYKYFHGQITKDFAKFSQSRFYKLLQPYQKDSLNNKTHVKVEKGNKMRVVLMHYV